MCFWMILYLLEPASIIPLRGKMQSVLDTANKTPKFFHRIVLKSGDSGWRLKPLYVRYKGTLRRALDSMCAGTVS